MTQPSRLAAQRAALFASITFVLGAALPAAAQTQTGSDRVFISIDGGAQPQQRTISTSKSYPLYDETATITATQPIKHGAVIEGSAGYRVNRLFGVAVGFSNFQSTSTSTVTASIPDPVFVNRFRTLSTGLDNLQHSERALHVRAVFFFPMNEHVEVQVAGGPSVIRVQQDLVSSPTVPAGSQALTLTSSKESGTAAGFNAGFDLNYWFVPNFGLGLFGGYAGGKVDLPSVSDLDVGGLRFGAGVRLRF